MRRAGGRGRIDRGRGLQPAPRQSASGPRPRGRGTWEIAAGVGVCERADSGGGEPRAARARSAPPPPACPAPRRARSLPGRQDDPVPIPKLRPVFLWARQHEGRVQEVRCEDYDPRNRIRIARTANGWRVIPRTEIYNLIRVPPLPPPERRDRRRRRRFGKWKRRQRPQPQPPQQQQASAWLAPDLESHIPSHTIAVPRVPTPRAVTPPVTPPVTPGPPEPTPLDNLLAVAELEFNQQRGSDLLDLDATSDRYAFLPEEAARDVMSFNLGEPKQTDDLFFDGKSHASVERTEESGFQNDMNAHKDLFDTISEVHYLPELGGPHDEALLESLVEKGCEDNQILGQALDKLAHLVHGSGDYAEEEDDMLLSGAPVADIIDRLEQSLESPGRSSMTAAQGLLHLHHIADHLPPGDHQVDQTYMPNQVFEEHPPPVDPMGSLTSHTDHSEVNPSEYDQSNEKRLESGVETTNMMYTESVPDTHENYNKNFENHESQALPDQSELSVPNERLINDTNTNICENTELNPTHTDLNTNNREQMELEDLGLLQSDEIKQSPGHDELEPTDLSIKHVEKDMTITTEEIVPETTNANEDNMSEKSDEQPKDLSFHRRQATPHASPRRTELPRAPSRESDAMQSPQPSGIPAVPSSPELFIAPTAKSKQALFLETLLSSPSPKMYTSEVTITKQQCEPLNLGKHRKSASPTVTSCSDEIRKLNKDFGEPQEKKVRRESLEDIMKVSKVFGKSDEDSRQDSRRKTDKIAPKSIDDMSPIRQLQFLKMSTDFNIPDPLLVPKDKITALVCNPGREIPALLSARPELRLPEAFAFPAVLQDPNIVVLSLAQLENILENEARNPTATRESLVKASPTPTIKPPSTPTPTPTHTPTPTSTPTPAPASSSASYSATSTERTNTTTTTQAETSQHRQMPSTNTINPSDIDLATSQAIAQMFWLPYLSQVEAMTACSQNMDFLKALGSSGYGPNYQEFAQMLNQSGRLPVGPSGFPMVPPVDYENRLQFAMWQEAMNQANAAQRNKPSSTLEAQMKEMAQAARNSGSGSSNDVQNPYVHSTKNHHNKPHSSARTSPIAHNYNNNQRSMAHNQFLQGMYPGMNPNIRPNMALPGLQIPYFNPSMMSGGQSQRSPRTSQQKSPTSPYYPNNNYLQSLQQKQAEAHHQRSNSTSSQESPRPRISVKSLQNLLEPSAAAASGDRMRRNSSNAALGRRREEPEVGSTTPSEPPPHLPLPPNPHDPSSFHLWHPLFGNQKSYASPWSWTTVTATGD